MSMFSNELWGAGPNLGGNFNFIQCFPIFKENFKILVESLISPNLHPNCGVLGRIWVVI